MKALDLFCGAGGASRGLQMAGYEVTGVDIKPQPHYIGDHFYQADALTFPLEGYDLIWASPPCQDWSVATPAKYRGRRGDFITPIRERLQAWGGRYIIENVGGARARLKFPVMLCGTMFGLRVQRHRFFECNPQVAILTPGCSHKGLMILMQEAGSGTRAARRKEGLTPCWPVATIKEASGIDWMTRTELADAIPPVYAEYLAKQIGSEKRSSHA